MAIFGGTDTRGLAQADATGRRMKLQAEMAAIEQSNQYRREQVEGVRTAGAALQQREDSMRRESLEAARTGLEYDPETRRYQQSVETKERAKRGEATDLMEREQRYRHKEESHQLEGAATVEGVKVEQSKVGLKARELGIREREGKAREKSASAGLRLKQEDTALKHIREERLARETLSESKEKATAARATLEKGFRSDIMDYDKMLKQAMTGGDNLAFLPPAIQERLAGAQGSEGSERAIDMIHAMRTKRVIEHASHTGDLLMFDPSAEEAQGFIQMMALSKAGLNKVARSNPAFSSWDPERRHRFLVRLSANLYLRGELERALRMTQDGAQAGPPGGQSPGKFGNQPPTEPGGTQPGQGPERR